MLLLKCLFSAMIASISQWYHSTYSEESVENVNLITPREQGQIKTTSKSYKNSLTKKMRRKEKIMSPNNKSSKKIRKIMPKKMPWTTTVTLTGKTTTTYDSDLFEYFSANNFIV